MHFDVTASENADLDVSAMQLALAEAMSAQNRGEVPVGAIVALEGRVVGRGQNVRESERRPTGHAEILAIEEASEALGRWRLSGCTLYVTLEPCLMCAGAIVNARLDRVVYGARDPKAGAVESLYSVLGDPRLNHRPEVLGGVLAEKCGQLLTQFFQTQRALKKS